MAILSPVSFQDKQTEGKHLWCISHMLCVKWGKMVVKTWKQQWFREGRNRPVKARAWFSLASHSSPSTQHCGQLALTSLFLHSRMKENPALVTQVLWGHTESKKLHEQKALLGNVCPSVLWLIPTACPIWRLLWDIAACGHFPHLKCYSQHWDISYFSFLFNI